MSNVETTIQSIQDGLEKINDGIGQMMETAFKDVVKEEQLENFMLDEDVEDKMARAEIRAHYEGKYDKYEKKVHELENDKKQLENFFQSAEKTKKQLEEILYMRKK